MTDQQLADVLLGEPPAESANAVTPTVKADIKADLEGKPRPTGESPPPPGTEREPYLKSAGFKAAVLATFVAVDTIWVVPWTTSEVGGEGSLLIRIAMWMWLASIGIKNPETLRWK